MQLIIWIISLGGMFFAASYSGQAGQFIYFCAVALIIALFRRPLVLALTQVASRFGLMREVIERMPFAIHLAPVQGPTDAARPILNALLACKFVDAGAWKIGEMPKIEVSLMVQPEHGMLAAVESVAPLGAHVNLHTLYQDGQVVSFTNSELPLPQQPRPNVTRTRVPRCSPGALVTRARNQRPSTPFRPISIEEAPRVYEQLYAAEALFRKTEAQFRKAEVG